MKKTVSFFTGIVLLLSIYANTFATDETSSGGFKAPIMKTDLNFTAKRDGAYVYTSWKMFNLEEKLVYYKVVRSTTKENPVYPDDGYIKYDTDINFTSYKHYDDDATGAYYRVCAITNLYNRYCSNVVKVAGYVGEKKVEVTNPEVKKEEVKKDDVNNIIKEKIINDNAGLSEIYKQKANLLISTFITKLDKTNYTNEKKVEAINKIITKLNELKNQKPTLKNLVYYIVRMLEEKRAKYQDDFGDIEKIFDIGS